MKYKISKDYLIDNLILYSHRVVFSFSPITQFVNINVTLPILMKRQFLRIS